MSVDEDVAGVTQLSFMPPPLEGLRVDYSGVEETGRVAEEQWRSLARRGDPDTSKRAAQKAVGGAATSRAQVLALLRQQGRRGVTHEELERLCAADARLKAYKASGLRTRLSELRDAGLVLDTGNERFTSSGSAAKVWAATSCWQEER